MEQNTPLFPLFVRNGRTEGLSISSGELPNGASKWTLLFDAN
jgi:hypothetical protein